jgi:excinuclease ABC subunit C
MKSTMLVRRLPELVSSMAARVSHARRDAQMGVKQIPAVGLAKQHEEIYVQDLSEPVVLPRHSQALYLVQRLRDEAHRFAITYHRGVRSKTGMQSALDTIPGVGPKRKKALLRKFGSVRGIREAPVDEIAATVGFTGPRRKSEGAIVAADTSGGAGNGLAAERAHARPLRRTSVTSV